MVHPLGAVDGVAGSSQWDKPFVELGEVRLDQEPPLFRCTTRGGFPLECGCGRFDAVQVCFPDVIPGQTGWRG